MTTTTISILLFGGAGLILIWAMSGSRQVAAEGGTVSTNLHDYELQANGLERMLYPFLVRVGRMIARLLPPGRLEKLRKRIMVAGKQLTWNVERAMAYKVLGLIVGSGVAAFLLYTGTSRLNIAGAVLFVGCGYFGIDYYLDKLGTQRQLEIQQALPDILDQISVCVEAGLGFDAAMHRVVATNDNILSDEFGRTLQDIRLGVPRAQAMRAMLDRTNVQELRLFVRALIQAERSGIPIARVLLVQSEEVREKRRQAAEERAMRMPVMLIMPLVLCILPSLFTVIMGPAVLRLIRSGAV